MKHSHTPLIVCLFAIIPFLAVAQIPPGYYDLAGLTPADLTGDGEVDIQDFIRFLLD